jgi:hypothetical protein
MILVLIFSVLLPEDAGDSSWECHPEVALRGAKRYA